jgi:GAF domain-containing protein
MDRAGHQLLPLAGPNFPSAVTAALAPWPVGPNRGCCGTAAFTGERVIISDLSIDPRWPQDDQGEVARRLVLDQGLRAAWSEPLILNSGEVLGTFCIGYSQPRTPTSLDLQLIEAAGHIARIAIERHQSQEALTAALAEI